MTDIDSNDTEGSATTRQTGSVPWELVAGISLAVVFLSLLAFKGGLQTHDPFAGNLDMRFVPMKYACEQQR